MTITYDISGKYEQEFVINKFNKAIKTKDLKLAMSIQKYIIKACEEGRYTKSVITDMLIPDEKQYTPFIINKQYIANIMLDKIDNNMCEAMSKCLQYENKNDYAIYGTTVCDVVNADINNEGDVRTFQDKVEKIGSLKKVPKEKFDLLNLELQFKIIDFADTINSPTIETLLTNTYDKIKSIVNIENTTWMNAYKLANIFIEHGDYAYAEYLMSPFINKKEISNDFLFTYLTLYSYREELYLSNRFYDIAKKCLEIDKARFCSTVRKFSFQVQDNLKFKELFCTECQ